MVDGKKSVKKKDFVEIVFSGYANGNLFDSNKEDDMKKLDPNAKPKETIIIVGEGMVVKGLDKELEGKEVGKDYEIDVKPKDGFGERKRELMKTIPLKMFTEKRVNPKPGMVLNLDNMIARIITVSGARVVTDFNNPMAGKDLKYKIKIVKKIEDEKTKIKVVLEFLFKFSPEFEIKGNKVIIKGPKAMEPYIALVLKRFKELTGKDLDFSEKKVETTTLEKESSRSQKEKSKETTEKKSSEDSQ